MRELSLLGLGLTILCCFIAFTSPVVATANAAVTTTSRPPPIYINNKVPTVDVSCMVRYKCIEKLKGATVPPKPCVKYCVKFIECPNATKIRGTADQCVELDEAAVRRQYEQDTKSGESIHVMKVAMIDFPCRPGFLPDDMGRCREVW
ncbi:uncharacterized protein LOC128860469 [Anastrepha ludens]|uniref:uncharacterized protein LOC128860469 n=1 Tax=Anastrepha ludens TaxID=28586 RepID=UPI0023AE7309|nr:uncharacterized protein LOC128860469 [Anastrepha ludens]